MNDEQLQRLVCQVSQEKFGCAFKHHALFNKRLRTTGGRYLLVNHNIEINPKMIMEHDRSTIIGIIKHELCHYHLHLTGQGYHHRDQAFKQLLQKVGGLRYTPPAPRETEKLRYRCSNCGQEYFRSRRINTNRYVCSKCRGKLVLIRKVK
ncbi:SprT family protein [Liquorilactobacillus capillatus]|uniref:SprT-like domain-containing protein n=1 Tax=Liquorilactobacillus capillatus DSM 19910 TaxID=1423731 RepID=A0A0R1M407_9LACO|nr:SprT family protein [Liquorilactobacillus capillatus]KRL02783.1 hypothetical protein FC81_GL000427 [Liquorilactobacillus capillatus DSM 19910]